MKDKILLVRWKRYIAGSFWDGDDYQYCGNCDHFQDPCDTPDLLGAACDYWKFGIPLTEEYLELGSFFRQSDAPPQGEKG